MKTKRIILIAILLVGAVLRLYKLASIPPHLTPDEASLGYNAYSILKTGRDEHGEFMPIIFKSFGDYKPGLYVYLTVPSIFILGLNEFSVRLPNALCGILAIYLIYLIAKKLFPKEKNLDVYSAALLAINPWHIHFSRGAWEVNLSLTLTLFGIYFFLLSLKKQKYILLTALFWGLTLTAYQGAKLATSIIALILFIYYRKDLFKFDKKLLSIGFLIGLTVSVPIILSIFSGMTGRLKVFSIFSYPRPDKYLSPFLAESGVKKGSLAYYAFYSEAFNFARGIMGRWFNHFSARFLFFEGDWANPRHGVPYHGMLLIFDMLLVAAGLFAMLKNKIKKEYQLVLIWLVLAVLPSALSRDQVHAVRSFNMLIPLVFVNAIGLKFIIDRYKKTKYVLAFLFLVFVGNYSYYLDAYFVQMPHLYSKYWDYGYKQIVELVTPIQNNYKEIRIQQSYAQPYIYFLFYQKYDPKKYQSKDHYVPSEFSFDVGKVEELDNIKFASINWPIDRGRSNTLYVADIVRIPIEDSSDGELFNEISEIKYLDNLTLAFRAIEVK